MSNYSLLLDVAKARQAELLHEVEMTRITRALRSKRKANSILKKLQVFLATMA
jgi:hypothetical protein